MLEPKRGILLYTYAQFACSAKLVTDLCPYKGPQIPWAPYTNQSFKSRSIPAGMGRNIPYWRKNGKFCTRFRSTQNTALFRLFRTFRHVGAIFRDWQLYYKLYRWILMTFWSLPAVRHYTSWTQWDPGHSPRKPNERTRLRNGTMVTTWKEWFLNLRCLVFNNRY